MQAYLQDYALHTVSLSSKLEELRSDKVTVNSKEEFENACFFFEGETRAELLANVKCYNQPLFIVQYVSSAGQWHPAWPVSAIIHSVT